MGDSKSKVGAGAKIKKAVFDTIEKGDSWRQDRIVEKTEKQFKASMEAILGAKDLLVNIFSGLDETTKQLNEQEKIQLELLQKIIENESLPMDERLKASAKVYEICDNNMEIKNRHIDQVAHLALILVVALAGGAYSIGKKKIIG
jgi:hypothetical protein